MKENENELGYTGEDNAYPQKITLTDGDTIVMPGLTKLELISAMCLQGMFANPNIKMRAAITKVAIDYAKELLKQLEAENDTGN